MWEFQDVGKCDKTRKHSHCLSLLYINNKPLNNSQQHSEKIELGSLYSWKNHNAHQCIQNFVQKPLNQKLLLVDMNEIPRHLKT